MTKKAVSATKLADQDELADVTVYKEQKNVILQSKNGYFLRFLVSEIPEKKKAAIGVRAMKLLAGDEIEAVYYTKNTDETAISYKDRTLVLNQLRAAGRDSRGTKVRG